MGSSANARLDRLQSALRLALVGVPAGWAESTLEAMIDALVEPSSAPASDRLSPVSPPKGSHVTPPDCPCASEGCKIARVRAVLASYEKPDGSEARELWEAVSAALG